MENIVCPNCHLPLKKINYLKISCLKCGKIYSVQNNVPIFWDLDDEKNIRIKHSITQELDFTTQYVNVLTKSNRLNLISEKEKKLFQEEKEFFERDGGKSTAAYLVDQKAFKTLKKISKTSFQGLKILCLGAGGGREADWLLKYGAREITCLDISYPLLTLAQKRLKKKPVKFILASAEKLPFKDNSFDLAFFFATLHHVKNPQLALKEACRIAPRIALVSEPAQMGLITYVLKLIHWNIEYANLACHRFSTKEICQILTKKGYRATSNTNFIWFPFQIFDRFKNNQYFLHFYFLFLAILDLFAGKIGHNLTLYAEKRDLKFGVFLKTKP